MAFNQCFHPTFQQHNRRIEWTPAEMGAVWVNDGLNLAKMRSVTNFYSTLVVPWRWVG
ncbi:hypothetical protein QQ215_002056 [Vibrio vulnificus]|nr:hypothetical protein [Vibrio vulnificus]HDY7865238.1 hypothetical protein [Vibrio vulnificus]